MEPQFSVTCIFKEIECMYIRVELILSPQVRTINGYMYGSHVWFQKLQMTTLIIMSLFC